MAEGGAADVYRLSAEKCLELAHTIKDLESKRTLLGMANAWLTLAEQHLRNRDTAFVYETQTTAIEPPTTK